MRESFIIGVSLLAVVLSVVALLTSYGMPRHGSTYMAPRSEWSPFGAPGDPLYIYSTVGDTTFLVVSVEEGKVGLGRQPKSLPTIVYPGQTVELSLPIYDPTDARMLPGSLRLLDSPDPGSTP